MKPAEIVGALGWLGWLVGIVAGVLQFHGAWRERRLGPAKEQLFEEALRDRKGAYSEAQIAELTKLVGALERQVRREIPRQARRAFVESQIVATGDQVLAGVRQYQQLSKEFAELTGRPQEIPPAIAQVAESSLVAPAIERHKQQRRLLLVMVVLIVVAAFPGFLDYLFATVDSLLGSQPYPFGPRNAMTFAAGTIVAICVAFAIPDTRIRRAIRSHPRIAFTIGTSFCMFGILAVVYIGSYLATGMPFGWLGNFTGKASVFSNICIAAGIRILFLLRRKPIAP